MGLILAWLRARRTLLFLGYLPLFWAGLLGIYMKAELANGYSRAVAKLLTPAGNTGIDAPLTDAWPFFARDILVNLVGIPLVILTILVLVFRKRAAIAACVVACVMVVFYFIQLQAEQIVGEYQSAEMMSDAFKFVRDDHDQWHGYVSARASVKVLCLIAFVVCSWLIVRFEARNRVLGGLAKTCRAGVAACVGMLLMMAAVFYPFHGYTGLHDSAVGKAAFAFFAPADVNDEYKGKSLAESIASFRGLTKTPIWNAAADPLAGKEKNANLLFFLMETGPADVIPENDFVSLLPPAIANNTLIAQTHYTTYPYTSDALFSLLTGLYPDGRHDVVARGGFKHAKVLFELMDGAGYETSTYLPNLFNTEVDASMLKALGLNKVFVADRTPDAKYRDRAAGLAAALTSELEKSSPHFETARHAEMLRRLTNDLNALEELKADLRARLATGKPFAYLFMPQIAHGPWLHIGPDANYRRYGFELMKLETRWLAEIVQIIGDSGKLPNTVVFVTADHGIRTNVEDPAFKPGSIDSYSFHVPLALYAPAAFGSRQYTTAMTSHVDVDATLTALLGLRDGEAYSEGIPLWAATAGRRLYFSAEGFGGASGFHEGGFYMSNVLSSLQYRSDSMKFDSQAEVLTDPQERAFVTSALLEFRRTHFAIVTNR